ncbi:hypothetical protein DCC85_12940 [Paenibacillus sp. CAA11]|uniref:hypothetical protein n=1 Tax=Paenibacillus sp. CAA11 TaxID=1532905 RepID=UPI000D3837F4|nr:hypothetical protein [Paenibacillus sp. CAA11]AWB45039.1 hypothetical protein DCC85_12940 [Paenibacillus sp. CAA11]
MNERLSRVERLSGSRRQLKKRAAYTDSKAGNEPGSSGAIEVLPKEKEVNRRSKTDGVNLREQRNGLSTSRSRSRQQKKLSGRLEEEVDLEAGLTEDLPSRSELFPSSRNRVQKWFFNSLLILFIALTVLLLWWGMHESPWGLKHLKS